MCLGTLMHIDRIGMPSMMLLPFLLALQAIKSALFIKLEQVWSKWVEKSFFFSLCHNATK